MDIATIKGAYDAVSFAKKALENFVDTKADEKAKEKVAEALDRLGSVQDLLFSLREELSRLQGENAELKDKLRTYENWTDRAAPYALHETAGGAVVYKSEGPPQHFACPRCYEKREIQILQNRRTASGTFECPCCQADYPINPRQNINPVIRTRKP